MEIISEAIPMEALGAISANAEQQITWAIAVMGGTLLIVIGTSHISPKSRRGRLIYLLFLPAWFFLGVSIYYGNRIHRHLIADHLSDANTQISTLKQVNSDAICQMNAMGVAGLFLATWLLLYVSWWIFLRDEK